MEETIDVRSLYEKLRKTAEETPFKEIDLFVRTRGGIKPGHSENILLLYFYHLSVTNKELYRKLKTAKDDTELKKILGTNKVLTNYYWGCIRSVCARSDLFDAEFLKIINAYLNSVER